MSRPEIVQAGLEALLRNLPNLEQDFFEATATTPDQSFEIDDSHEVALFKEGFTRSGYKNIPYTIAFLKKENKQDITKKLTFYVHNPSPDDASINMNAAASAVEYFLTTGSAITTRDEYAIKPDAA